jgi:predicted AAA+ superfamily ATPase
MKYIPRHLESILKKRYGIARSIYLFGPRQSGKTTLIRRVFPKLPYVSLENPQTLAFSIEDPIGFLGQYPKGAILDEAQRNPEIFSYLQEHIDLHEKKYVLTGSQNFLMMERVSQSLAGRIHILNLQPLSMSEVEQRKAGTLFKAGKKKGSNPAGSIFARILKGGYPAIHIKKENFEFWFGDYVKTYMERDVRQVLNIKNTHLFQRFIGLCCGRAGNVLNHASLASDTGISESNVRNWLSILEQSGLIFRLRPYHINFGKRLIKHAKIFFTDTGLLCYLLGIRSERELSQYSNIGSIFENFVIQEIRKFFFNRGMDPLLYFWRDHRGEEVDLLIEEKGELHGVEIKLGATYQQEFAKSLLKWQGISGSDKTHIIYGGKNAFIRNGIQVHSAYDL